MAVGALVLLHHAWSCCLAIVECRQTEPSHPRSRPFIAGGHLITLIGCSDCPTGQITDVRAPKDALRSWPSSLVVRLRKESLLSLL